MAIEFAPVQASFIVEGENPKGGPNDANRVTVQKLNDNVGHAYASSREAGNALAWRIPEHPLELSKRQAIQTVVVVEQKYTA